MRYCVVILLALAIHGSSASLNRDLHVDDDQNEDHVCTPFGDDQNCDQSDDDQNYDQLVDQLDGINQFERMALEALKLRSPVTVEKRSEGFSWKSCASISALVDVNSISVTPDVFKFPGTVYVSAQTIVKKSLPSPIKMEVTLQKKIGWFWLPVPCIGKIGSCTYNDICPMLPTLAQCPIEQKRYDLYNQRVDLPAANVPGGIYWIKGDLSHNGQQVACVEAYFNIG